MPLLGEAILGLDNSWAFMRHVTIVLNLRQIPLGPIIPIKQPSLIFPTHMTQFRILFNGSQSFLVSLSSVYSQQERKKGLYLRDRAPTSSLCING